MKIVILYADDKAQLVLKPESKFERQALEGFHDATPDGMTLRKGSFSECQAGYYREFLTNSRDEDFILTALPRS